MSVIKLPGIGKGGSPLSRAALRQHFRAAMMSFEERRWVGGKAAQTRRLKRAKISLAQINSGWDDR